MTEAEIRQLEIEAAKVMGWEDIQIESRLDKHYTYIDDWYGVKPPNTGVYAIPGYARDPAAILSALEWWFKGNRTIGHIGDTFLAHWVVLENGFRYKETVSGETLGIAICRAIVALGESAQKQQEAKSNV